MPSAFFTGLSGLRAHSRAVEVIANNLANLNTISFKGSRADFRDLFYQQIGQSRSGVASQVGIGVSPITVSRRFEQGTIQNTSGLLDAAIQGEGFFIVQDGDLTQYTRAGNFQINALQQLVTIDGARVQGWVRDTTGNLDTNLPFDDITLQGQQTINPTATSDLLVRANLQAGSATPFSRPVQVFDALGDSHILTMTFTPVVPARAGASSSFDLTVTIPAEDVIDELTGLPPGADVDIVSGTPFAVDFDGSGALIIPLLPTITLDMAAVAPAIEYANGAADMLLTWDLLDNLGQPTLTSFGSPSAVTELFQNGSAAAELTSISISDGGDLSGLYSDGRTLTLARIGLARFTNPQTLVAVGNNNYVPTAAAGTPTTGEANTAGLGSVVGLSLEFSNVDIAQEFTNLLTFQRGFQANSRVITTADELNQEALNLKR
ncbi:MAG: flagellar hook protein FlgE [Acidobacteria bacterium]|nr:flagellar hook protein FlgE [Acidobacteriota bacterium]